MDIASPGVADPDGRAFKGSRGAHWRAKQHVIDREGSGDMKTMTVTPAV